MVIRLLTASGELAHEREVYALPSVFVWRGRTFVQRGAYNAERMVWEHDAPVYREVAAMELMDLPQEEFSQEVAHAR